MRNIVMHHLLVVCFGIENIDGCVLSISDHAIANQPKPKSKRNEWLHRSLNRQVQCLPFNGRVAFVFD